MPFCISLRVEPHEAWEVINVYRDWLTPTQIAQITQLGEAGKGCLILKEGHFVEVITDPADENHPDA